MRVPCFMVFVSFLALAPGMARANQAPVVAPGIVPLPAPVPTSANREPGVASPPIDRRIGIDGSMTVGLAFLFVGSLRYEVGIKGTSSTGLLRLGGGTGAVFADENSGRDVLMAHLGYRWYYGAAYAGVEGGLVGLRASRFSDFGRSTGVKWDAGPNFSAGVGVKLGPVDLGVSLLFPLASIAVSLGIEFGWHAPPPRRAR
jgi:hypothetical protein